MSDKGTESLVTSTADEGHSELHRPPLVDLPEGKIAHFFISYSSEDRHIVYPYVVDIEQRFGVRCIYADRDFQPGMDISANIRHSMARSMKVLLFLSPNFVRSGFCKYERELAFVISADSGWGNTIIPVLLQQCDLPFTLMTLTYINAEFKDVDVPAKVVEALHSSGTENILPTDFFLGPKRCENGSCLELFGVRDNLTRIRPAKYYFSLDDNLPQKLKANNLQIPFSVLRRSVREVNRARVMRSYDFLQRSHVTMWSLAYLLPLFGLVYFLGLVGQQARFQGPLPGHNTSITVPEYFVLFALLIVFPIAFVLLIVLVPICCRRRQRYTDVQRSLWEKFGHVYIDTSTLVLFSRWNNLPILKVMRFDVSKCRDFLVDRINKRGIPLPDIETDPTKWVDSLISSKLGDLVEKMSNDYDTLPEAPFPRHLMRKDKMCLCQMLEDDLVN